MQITAVSGAALVLIGAVVLIYVYVLSPRGDGTNASMGPGFLVMLVGAPAIVCGIALLRSARRDGR